MVNSVNRGLDAPAPKNLTHEYKGEGWVDEKPDWQPATKNTRYKILEEEKKHIKSFKRADLPGYGVISISERTGDVILHYYNGFAEKPYETISLTDLQNKR